MTKQSFVSRSVFLNDKRNWFFTFCGSCNKQLSSVNTMIPDAGDSIIADSSRHTDKVKHSEEFQSKGF